MTLPRRLTLCMCVCMTHPLVHWVRVFVSTNHIRRSVKYLFVHYRKSRKLLEEASSESTGGTLRLHAVYHVFYSIKYWCRLEKSGMLLVFWIRTSVSKYKWSKKYFKKILSIYIFHSSNIYVWIDKPCFLKIDFCLILLQVMSIVKRCWQKFIVRRVHTN